MSATPKPEPIITPELALGIVAEADLVTVRTTMKPDQDLRVSRAEAQTLEAQGLLAKKEKGATDAR